MARYYTVTQTQGVDDGPYTIYYNTVDAANIAIDYFSRVATTNIAGTTLRSGVVVEVPDGSYAVVVGNDNPSAASLCSTTSVSKPIVPVYTGTGWQTGSLV